MERKNAFVHLIRQVSGRRRVQASLNACCGFSLRSFPCERRKRSARIIITSTGWQNIIGEVSRACVGSWSIPQKGQRRHPLFCRLVLGSEGREGRGAAVAKEERGGCYGLLGVADWRRWVSCSPLRCGAGVLLDFDNYVGYQQRPRSARRISKQAPHSVGPSTASFGQFSEPNGAFWERMHIRINQLPGMTLPRNTYKS